MATKTRPRGATSTAQVPNIDAATELEVSLASRPDRMLEDAVRSDEQPPQRSRVPKLWPGLEIASALAFGVGVGALAAGVAGGLLGAFGSLFYLAFSAAARSGVRSDPTLHPLINAFEIDAPDIQAQRPALISGMLAAGAFGAGLYLAATHVGAPAFYLLPVAVLLPVSSVMSAWRKSQQRWRELSEASDTEE